MKTLTVLHAVFIGLVLWDVRGCGGKNVRASVTAGWGQTGVLHEAAEFVSDTVGEEGFWEFLKNVEGGVRDGMVEADLYEVALQAARDLNIATDLLNFALSTRYYSPKIAAQTELCNAENGTYVASQCGATFTDPTSLKTELSTTPCAAPHTSTTQGRVHHNVKDKNISGYTLCGSVADKKFKIFREILSTTTDGYVLRFKDEPGEDEENLVGLQGYGVTMMIKNMEYKAMDDREKDGGEKEDIVEEEETDDGRQVILGVKLDKVKEEFPVGDVELLGRKLREKESETEQTSDVNLAVWQIQDLGYQAAYKTLKSPSPLQTLTELSQDFPRHANSLSKISRSNYKRVMKALKSHSESQRANPFYPEEGKSAVFINNQAVDVDEMSAFSLYEMLQGFYKKDRALEQLLLHKVDTKEKIETKPTVKALSEISTIPPTTESDVQRRYNFDADRVSFLNDVETDEMYDDWNPRMMGLPPLPRKNIFTQINIVNPGSREGLTAAQVSLMLLRQMAPVRMGVVFVMGDEDDDDEKIAVDGGEAVTVKEAIACGFYEMQKTSPQQAFTYLFRLKMAGRSDEVTYDELQGVLGDVDVTEIVTPECLAKLKSNSEYIKGKGFSTTRLTSLFNGIMSVDNPQALMGHFQQEIEVVSEHLKILKTAGNPYETILKTTHAVSKHQPALDPTSITNIQLTPDDLDGVEWSYPGGRGEDTPSWVSMILVVDMDSVSAATLQSDFENFARPEGVRTAIIDKKHSKFTVTYPGSYLVVNGGVVKVSAEDGTELTPGFSEEDFEAAVGVLGVGGVEVKKVLEEFDGDNTIFMASKIASITSTLRAMATGGTTVSLPHITPQQRRIGFMKTSTSKHSTTLPSLDIIAVLNPLSEDAQKTASILQTLLEIAPATLSVYLNPRSSMTEVPLRTFYRYAIETKPRFSEEGTIQQPSVTFTRLPESQVLTIGIHEPEPWIVTTKEALYDLDNIKLSDIKTNVLIAKYKLDYLLVTGSCTDTATGQPPRGLPIVLHRDTDPNDATDTLVMSNLGYFQLKARPGTWKMLIQEGGKADRMYEKLSNSVGDSIVIDSFNGARVDVKAVRREGMEAEDLLSEDGIVEGMKEAGKPTLNIFSVATGHLYERFLKIMIHTTMMHAKKEGGRVKFWFLNNFLSPQFKENIHKMAEKWGFDVGLVTYKWPKWLRRQTQKQRIIWGYKVLFLDVLFPLDVDKVIYVDADQIVKSDLHELAELDLEGRSVGYTPFCVENANEETLGFRFWDSGYWKDHLSGRPYHISAIYVVDLAKFRRIAAGDQYRMIYDNLSQDPNSLSNLDQDLPNYSQSMVPIFSLPEHWLWCETWCNQESKEKAKTIDLCNNPLTKTPKLVNAKRIVPEWESYDKIIDDWEKSLE